MKKELFFVEVGVLLTPDDKEFDYYKINEFFDDRFGFYDENRLTFLNYDKAERYVKNYINEGVEKTYGFVHSVICNITDEELQEIADFKYCEASLCNPTRKNVEYFAYKENGVLKTIIM